MPACYYDGLILILELYRLSTVLGNIYSNLQTPCDIFDEARKKN